MKRCIIIFLASVLILSVLPLTQAQESTVICSDTDGGFYPYTKGTTTAYNGVEEDKSIESGVIEYGCIGNELRSVAFECQTIDGVCLYESMPTDSACLPTGSGVNVQGMLYKNTCARFSSTHFDDYLIKYSCGGNLEKVFQESLISCIDSGDVCVSGECVPLTEDMTKDIKDVVEVICKETEFGVYFGESFLQSPGCSDFDPLAGGYKKISRYVCTGKTAELKEENCAGDSVCVNNKCSPPSGEKNFIAGESPFGLIVLAIVAVIVVVTVIWLIRGDIHRRSLRKFNTQTKRVKKK